MLIKNVHFVVAQHHKHTALEFFGENVPVQHGQNTANLGVGEVVSGNGFFFTEVSLEPPDAVPPFGFKLLAIGGGQLHADHSERMASGRRFSKTFR